MEDEKMKVSKFKIAFLVPMLLLSFTVGIYNYRLFNTKVLGIEVWAHGQYEEEYLESWETVVNITNHPLKEKITYYMNESIQGELGGRGQRIYIFDPEVEAFFGRYYVSTWCGTCQIEMSPHFIDGNACYYVLIYYNQLKPSLLETCLAYLVIIATVILWIFYWEYLPKLKPELTTLEACHRLALSEGQKENKQN
jgi:hypothetical protein